MLAESERRALFPYQTHLDVALRRPDGVVIGYDRNTPMARGTREPSSIDWAEVILPFEFKKKSSTLKPSSPCSLHVIPQSETGKLTFSRRPAPIN